MTSIQSIAEEAREDFDLGEYLSDEGATIDDTVTVYTNKKAGRELGGVEQVRVYDELTGLPRPDFRTWGVMGQIFELKRERDGDVTHADKIAELKLEAERISEKLEASAIELTLHSIPPIIKKDAKRAARKHLAINGKTPDSPDHPQFEEYEDEHDSQILQRSVVSIKTLRDGKVRKGLSIENARKLKEQIDEREYLKIKEKLIEISYRRQIGEHSVQNPDF